jgi:hypothetical protein
MRCGTLTRSAPAARATSRARRHCTPTPATTIGSTDALTRATTARSCTLWWAWARAWRSWVTTSGWAQVYSTLQQGCIWSEIAACFAYSSTHFERVQTCIMAPLSLYSWLACASACVIKSALDWLRIMQRPTPTDTTIAPAPIKPLELRLPCRRHPLSRRQACTSGSCSGSRWRRWRGGFWAPPPPPTFTATPTPMARPASSTGASLAPRRARASPPPPPPTAPPPSPQQRRAPPAPPPAPPPAARAAVVALCLCQSMTARLLWCRGRRIWRGRWRWRCWRWCWGR